MKVLVTGATGAVGRCVVNQLVERGVDVRALTRNPQSAALPAGVEVVRGDLADPSSLSAAFVGVDRMFLFPVEDAVEEVVDQAKRAGVRRVAVLSAAAVTIGLIEEPVEKAVERAGLEWTHVRPGEFMMNRLYLWADPVRQKRAVSYPDGDELGVPVHEADIAAVAVTSLLRDGHAGQAYTVTGPEEITVREQVQAIAQALGEPVRFDEVSREEARRLMKQQGGFAAAHADFILGFVSYTGPADNADDYSELLKPWPTVEQVTGGPALSFARWARDHVDDFR